jgi:hypothetical protein
MKTQYIPQPLDDDLPESEKEYDRNTAVETLKVIQKLKSKNKII